MRSGGAVRRWLRGAGWTCLATGAFILYFLVYQLVGTGAAAGRSQEDLRQSLQQQWASQADDPVMTARRTTPMPPRRVAPGRAFALIQIPTIGVERVVVEGVGRGDLRKGPGHVPSTVMPGQRGTFAVSGHRTTYGAPFYRLDELRSGDRILITTQGWVFTYTVRRTQIPSDVWVLDNIPGAGGKPRATITLTTCHPRYSARQRLIVFGDLTSSIPKRGAAAA
jgi:sortase A